MTTAIIVKGYPRLSETFIAQEILGLQRLGQKQLIVSLRRPYDDAVHALNRAITAPVVYLPEYLHEEPRRVARARDWARGQPGYAAARTAFRADLRRDPTRNRWRRFGQACVLASELPDDVDFLYVHYLHTPASVARYAAMIRGLPYAVSAHAKDIWTTPAWELSEKLDQAEWVVTCTRANAAYLQSLAADPAKVSLLYHGLDTGRFPRPPARPPRDGGDRADPVRLLSVGRAVDKKGFDVLLDALARLPSGIAWRLDHVGKGERLTALQDQARRHGLADRVTWHGPLTQDRVIALLGRADLFVLAARPTESGDRDGLPNVLMEAQAMGLACLASDFSAIPELIEDGVTGRLVPPGDAGILAAALGDLIGDPALRARLGGAGKTRLGAAFSFDATLEPLARRFGLV